MNPLSSDIRAVVFDLDGTLLNTIQGIADSINTVLEKHSFPTHPVERYKSAIGNGFKALISDVLPDARIPLNRNGSILMEAYQEYQRCWKEKTYVYEGLSEVLDRINEQKIPMAILSNKPMQFVEGSLSVFLHKWSFTRVIGEKPGFPRKPDPAGLLAIAEAVSINTGKILMVGDSAVDIRTAKAAGAHSVGVTWGFKSRSELVDAGADMIIDKPFQLLELIGV